MTYIWSYYNIVVYLILINNYITLLSVISVLFIYYYKYSNIFAFMPI